MLIPVRHLTVQIAVTLLTVVNAVAPSTLELSRSTHMIAWERYDVTRKISTETSLGHFHFALKQ